jgi:hypothetical protein
VRKLLDAREARPSRRKDTVMAVGGKGLVLFARLRPDTPGKLHAHSLSYEALEVSSYELLHRVAEWAAEDHVVATAHEIAAEELEMMQRLEATFDHAVDASLRELGRPVSRSSSASTSRMPMRSRNRRFNCWSAGRSSRAT